MVIDDRKLKQNFINLNVVDIHSLTTFIVNYKKMLFIMSEIFVKRNDTL